MNKINIEKKGRRIVLTTDGPLPGIRSAIPGAYETVKGYWTVPLNYETCKLLQAKYGKRLKVGNELRRWAVGVRSSRDAMAKLASAKTAKLYHLPEAAPFLYKAMKRRPYQKVGSRFVADNPGTGIFDEPGLGKTLIAMGGILEAQIPGPYLVIAPKTASKPVWWREIRRWLPRWHKPITFADGHAQRLSRLRRTVMDEHTWVIVHPEMVMVRTELTCERCGKSCQLTTKTRRTMICGHPKTQKTQKLDIPRFPRLFEIDWGVIINDEAHESLIHRGAVPTQRRRGMDLLKVRADGTKLALTGTPMDDKPHNLWGTLNWLDPQAYPAFHRWAELYWRKAGYRGYEIGEFIKEREPLLWDSISAIALRRTKLEVAKDLPPKIEVGTPLDPDVEGSPTGIWLDMDGRQARAYEQMLIGSVSELKSGRLMAVTALSELTRLKQLASSYGDIEWRDLPDGSRKAKFRPTLPSNKYRWCIETLEEWGYPKNPIDKVVFVSFYTSLLEMFMQAIEKHFKTKPGNPLCAAISGKVSSAHKRAKIIERFNTSDHEHLMMLNVKAGGTAITLDSASRTIFLTETRIPSQQQQAEDRTHRVSNPRQCYYYYLRSIGTVDVGTAIANQELAYDSYRLLDERRGVDYLRYVIDHSR